MKLHYFMLLLFATSFGYVHAQVGVGTTTPKGALDINSANSGMLVPRVQLTSLTVAAPVTNPQTGALENGTLVYNLGPVAPGNLAAGFYYWNTTTWVSLAGGGSATPTDAWLTTGNTGTTASNYLGTSDDKDLYFKTKGTNRLRITSDSSFGQLLAYGGASTFPTYSFNDAPHAGMSLKKQGSSRKIIFQTDQFVAPPGAQGATSRFEIPSKEFQVHAMAKGTPLEPFYSWGADTNTGMFSPDPDILGFSTNGLERVRIGALGEVGIGTTTPKTKLEVGGAISLNEGTALTMVNGANNNVALGAIPYSMYRITGPTAAFNISGVVPIVGANGQMVTIENTTTFDMTLKHQSVSTATNQILVPGAKDLVLKGQYATATLQYNDTQKRWIVKSYAGEAAAAAISSQNIYSVKGTTDISQAAPSAIFYDMDQMTLTFTPKNSVVYVSCGASGDLEDSVLWNISKGHNVSIRIVNVTASNKVEGGSTSVSTDYGYSDNTHYIATGWNVHMSMFPVSVTPGVSTTIKLQWRSNSTGTTHLSQNYVSTYPNFSHRNLTIVD